MKYCVALLNSGNQHPQKEETVLMDFYCMEAFIDLPEFQVINQVIRPQQLDITFNETDTIATISLASVTDHRSLSPR